MTNAWTTDIFTIERCSYRMDFNKYACTKINCFKQFYGVFLCLVGKVGIRLWAVG